MSGNTSTVASCPVLTSNTPQSERSRCESPLTFQVELLKHFSSFYRRKIAGGTSNCLQINHTVHAISAVSCQRVPTRRRNDSGELVKSNMWYYHQESRHCLGATADSRRAPSIYWHCVTQQSHFSATNVFSVSGCVPATLSHNQSFVPGKKTKRGYVSNASSLLFLP